MPREVQTDPILSSPEKVSPKPLPEAANKRRPTAVKSSNNGTKKRKL